MGQHRAMGWVLGSVLSLAIGGAILTAQNVSATGPAKLQVDNLDTPLGIDDPAPSFSWQLRDPAHGARQTAYELKVATARERLAGKTDVWSSGRIDSAESLNVRYKGAALKPSTRYWWRVMVWGNDGKPYAAATSWFETGLLDQDAWKAQWIGFETTEEAVVRHAPAAWIESPEHEARATAQGAESRIAYRETVTLDKPVKTAALYATGQDTVAAWVNGKQVLQAAPFPAWHQMPWKKFVRADVTADAKAGANTIAIETVRYTATKDEAPPMSATLYVEYSDGSVATFASQPGWKSSASAAAGWEQPSFDDANWKPAEDWKPTPAPDAKALGHPWIPDSVKALRHTFELTKAIKSARFYSTSLGAYEMFLNGKRVSDDVLAPGWTDYRERVIYQSYDVTSLLAPKEKTPSARYWLRAGMPRRWNGSSSPTTMETRRLRCARSCALNTPMAACSGSRPTRAGAPGPRTSCIWSSTMARRRMPDKNSRSQRPSPITLRPSPVGCP